MTPDLERLARDHRGKLKVGRLDVDRNLATAERLGVKAFPTLLILNNGREIARLTDLHGYAELAAWVQRSLREPVRAQ
jgi:thioredoxin-like negative regulator of GroEL